MPVSPELATGLAAGVVQHYTEAERVLLERIAKALTKGIDGPLWAEHKLLEVQLIQARAKVLLTQLEQAAGQSVAEAILTAWNRGSAVAATDLAGVLERALAEVVDPLPGTRAVARLVEETTAKVVGTHPRILRSTMDVYREVVAKASAQVLLGTLTRREAAQAALDAFAKRGVTGFVDQRGRGWDMATYVETAVRSSTAHAAVAAHVDRLAAYGMDLVIVSDAPQECSLCLVPGTVVEGPVPTGRARLEYTGDVVRIVTASGNDLTGTPDHAVLTPGGWVALKDLHPGDQVISHDREQGYPGVVPDDVQVPTLIEKAGEAFAPFLLSGPTRRDLDSDRAYREVRAMWPDGNLLTERHTALAQPLRDLILVGAVGPGAPFLGADDVASALGSDGSSGCIMCRVEHGGSLLGSGGRPTLDHARAGHGGSLLMGLRSHELHDPVMPGTSLHTGTAQVVADHPTADAEGGAELLRALSGHVATDEIVSVGWRQFRGHVWDLSTGPAWFVANGIVTHNCRPWEGKVLSLSGGTIGTIDGAGGVRVAGTLPEATAAGLFHPGCRHSLGAYQPGITRAMHDTADPAGDAARQKLRYLERQVRSWKRAQAVALDPAAERKAGGQVRAYQGKIRELVATTSAKRIPAREQVGRAR